MHMQPARRPPLVLKEEDVRSPEFFSLPAQYRDSVGSVLIPHGLVLDRVTRLAQDIREDYGDATPHMLCVLKVCGASRVFRPLLLPRSPLLLCTLLPGWAPVFLGFDGSHAPPTPVPTDRDPPAIHVRLCACEVV